MYAFSVVGIDELFTMKQSACRWVVSLYLRHEDNYSKPHYFHNIIIEVLTDVPCINCGPYDPWELKAQQPQQKQHPELVAILLFVCVQANNSNF